MVVETRKTKDANFLKRYLIHSFLYWLADVSYTCIDYYLRIKKAGKYFIFYNDGSPLTVGKYFYNMNRYEYAWAKALIFVLLVELLRRFVYDKNRFILFLLWSFLGGIFWSFVINGYENLKFNYPFTFGNTLIPEIILKFTLYAIVYAVVIEFFEQKLYDKKHRLTKRKSEIDGLKAQVNPHFFFNTFNHVYGTALQENAPHTAKSLEMMTAMMRYTTSSVNESLVPLVEELQFIENYINLQLMRLPSSELIQIEVQLPKSNADGFIPPMLLIPIIENAFKYGISLQQKSEIFIEIKAIENNLSVHIENIIQTTNELSQGLGTGLKNVKDRLQLLYPKTHKFDFSKTDNRFKIKLTFPIY